MTDKKDNQCVHVIKNLGIKVRGKKNQTRNLGILKPTGSNCAAYLGINKAVNCLSKRTPKGMGRESN